MVVPLPFGKKFSALCSTIKTETALSIYFETTVAMLRIGARLFASSSRLSSAAPSIAQAAVQASVPGQSPRPSVAHEGATPHPKVSIKIAAKQVRPLNMSRSKRRNIIRKEQRMKRQIIRDVNNAKKLDLRNVKFSVDPVLGDPDNAFMHRVRAELQEPTNLAGGVEQREMEKLMYGAERATLTKNSIANNNSILFSSITEMEAKKRSAVLTILNMKNSNEQEKKKKAVQLAQQEFARTEGDTGSPEVQAAILTVKIHFLVDHIKRNFKDKVNIHRVRQMVQKRQSLLKYLKRDDPESYIYNIKKLGLTDDVVVREFSMDKQYMQDYGWWEDKVLVKLSDKQKDKLKKMDDLRKKVASYQELAVIRAKELADAEREKAAIRAQARRKAEQ
ncbi:37S ribosomal protein S28, mitochondrial [[Candida] zeylanoides]